MASSPLGQRAHIKGPQYDKRVLIKAPSPTYHIMVRLPSIILKHIRDRQNPQLHRSPAGGSALGNSSNNNLMMSKSGWSGLMSDSPPGSFYGASTSNQQQQQQQVGPQVDLVPVEELLQMSSIQQNATAYSAAYRDVIQVVVPSNATIRVAIQSILQRCEFTARHSDDFLLYQCFADFTVDDSRRGLYGDSTVPLKMILQFPYYLTLQIVPLVAVREKLTHDEEPQLRRAIVNEVKTFSLFALGYQDLLRKILTQQQLLWTREKETRKAKLLEESLYRFDLQRFMILRAEKETRLRMIHHVQLDWQLRLVELEANVSTMRRHEEEFDTFMVGIRAFRERFEARLLLAEVYQTWCRRLVQLEESGEEYAVEALRRKRDMYTESRIACCLVEAHATETHPEIVLVAVPRHLRCAMIE